MARFFYVGVVWYAFASFWGTYSSLSAVALRANESMGWLIAALLGICATAITAEWVFHRVMIPWVTRHIGGVFLLSSFCLFALSFISSEVEAQNRITTMVFYTWCAVGGVWMALYDASTSVAQCET